MRPLRVGLVFDLLGSLPRRPGDPPDLDVEFEPETTIELLEAALVAADCEPVRLGSPRELLARLSKGEPPAVDAALNVAEGHGTRNREAWAPVLLEMAGIPTLGSDALTLSVSLDKAWTRTLVAAAGVAVAPGAVVPDVAALARTPLPDFPLFVKPRWEGTAKGIRASSRVEDGEALRREVARVVADYDQPALVEAFLDGPEYTVTVVGHAPPRALPVLQRALETRTRIGLHALAHHSNPEVPSSWEHCIPGDLDPPLEAALAEASRAVFQALECRDFARADFRLDARGTPRFLEVNPLPTFAPDGSFAVHAELRGEPLAAFLAGIFAEALARLGLR